MRRERYEVAWRDGERECELCMEAFACLWNLSVDGSDGWLSFDRKCYRPMDCAEQTRQFCHR